ncbi:MAG: universal stress protein [Vicingaceae bacterium]
MNKILLCTDCSENAKQATDQCLFLFKDQPTTYLLLYTYSIEDKNVKDLVAYNDGLKKHVNQCLEAEVERIKKLPYAQNISIVTRSVFGKTENVIKRFIAKSEVDLIAIGNQGNNYSTTRLFGSTAERLLYDIERPKLIVPKQLRTPSSAKEVLVVQENELHNMEWWSTVTAISKLDNLSFKLVVLPNAKGNKAEISIPSSIHKYLTSLTDFSTSTTSELKEQIQKVIQAEKPSLLHLNIKDLYLAEQLLKESQPINSVFNKVPFFVQPFRNMR